MEAPFKHWYAIAGVGCWYIGCYINKEDAEKKAIRELNVHHSKIGYCIADKQVLESIYNSIKGCLESENV
jgi:hypothetical protein